MRIRLNQKGFEAFAVLIVVVVLAIIALAGYKVTQKSNGKEASSVSVPAQLKTKADLQQANKALDAQSIDKDLNSDQLSADIKAL